MRVQSRNYSLDGVSVSQNAAVAPYSGDFLVCSAKYLISFFESNATFLKSIAFEETTNDL